MDDDLLLSAILACDDGVILNIVQAAAELTGTMSERLSKAYFEQNNGDTNPDTEIRLK